MDFYSNVTANLPSLYKIFASQNLKVDARLAHPESDQLKPKEKKTELIIEINS
jgi:hypothetical protein